MLNAGGSSALAAALFLVTQDVSVVGYDNNDICEGILPSLTTVDHRLEELGQCLAQGVLALIEGKTLKIQKSCASPRGETIACAPRIKIEPWA